MKYIIDVPNQDYSYNEILNMLKLRFYDDNLSCEVILDAEQYTEPDHKDIENEVWAFAWEVLQLDLPVFRKIFGYNTAKMDYRDYKYKYEAWKKQKDSLHGEWIDTGSGQECSVCGEIQYGYDTGRHYCPNCGRKMDGIGHD